MTTGRVWRRAAWVGVAAGLCGTLAHAGSVGVVAVDGCVNGGTAQYAGALRTSLARSDGRVMTAEDTVSRVGGAPRGTIADAERLLASARYDVFDQSSFERAERTLLTAIDDLRTLPPSDARWQDLKEAHTLLAFLYVRQEKKQLAEEIISRALAVDPKLRPSEDLYPPSFRAFVDDARKKATRGATATLRVTTQPNNVPVFVDGKDVGRSPVIMKLPPGRHRVEADFGTGAFLPRTVELNGEAAAELRKDFDGQIYAGRGPCLGTDGTREGRLRAMVRLASFLGADELVGVRAEEPTAGERFVVATVVDARTGQETREGKIKLGPGSGAGDAGGIARLAEFLSTGAAVPPVEVALGGRPAAPVNAAQPAGAVADASDASGGTSSPGTRATPAPAAATAPNEVAAKGQPSGSGSALRTAGFVTGGVGLVSLGAGGFFLWQASQTQGEIDRLREGDTFPEDVRAKVDELQLDREAQQGRAMIAAGVGAAALATGVVLYLLGGDDEPAPAQAIRVTPTGNGVRVQF